MYKYYNKETDRYIRTTDKSSRKAGWSILSIVPAPPLLLTSQDLGKRYSLGKHRLAQICTDMVKHSVAKDDTFGITPDGFEALLRYQIFTSIAI